MPITDRYSQKFTVSDCWPAVGLFAACLVGLAIMTTAPQNAAGAYAVVAPPWSSAAKTITIIDAAGGNIIGIGGFSNIVVAQSADPLFLDALREAGAWLVLSAAGADLCSGSQTRLTEDPL
jgi:hypothetical protein